MRGALLCLFFLSGVSALIYQVVWVRMLGLVFGVTSFAVATVLCAFMAGLALGSVYGGRFIDRRRSPLLVFACLQISIGVFALLFPALVSGLTFLYVFVHRQWPASFFMFSLLRFALAFGLLLVPTTLMGATLPVLAKFFVRRRGELGSDVGALYAVNNLGAVLGALAAGFVLIQALGVRETSYLAAAISIAVGLVALYFHQRSSWLPAELPAREQPLGAERAAEPYPEHVLHVVLWVFAIEGFTSLGYEVIWTRMLSASHVVVTVYAYSLVVAMFLAGLAIGSFLIRKFADRIRDVLSLLAGIELAIGVTAVLLLPQFRTQQWLSWLAGPAAGWGELTVATAVWLGALMLVPTTLMGATFPLVSKIYTANIKELGRRIGTVGCLDTVGSIFGAFAGGFVLIPLLGMQRSVLLLASINMATGLAVILSHPAMAWKRKCVVGLVLVPCAVTGYVFIPHDVRFVPGRFAQGDVSRDSDYRILSYDEGVDSTVVVLQTMYDSQRVLAIDGVDVAGTGRLLETTQVLQGHLPVMLYESHNGRQPKRVLTVGLGSGGTSAALSLHDLEEIHCVELVPAVLRAAKKYFKMVNRGVFDDPRYRVFIQDGRDFVLSSDTKYDVIMSESTHPGFQGNDSLYSRDFLLHCRQRLSEDGVMSVWMPLYKLSSWDLMMICRTFLGVFPHATLWRAYNEHNKHMILIGTQRELSIDFERLRDLIQEPAIRRDLARLDLDDAFVLLNCLLLDEQAIRAYSSGARVHSDNHPYLAFSAPKSMVASLPSHAWLANLDELMNLRTSVLPHIRHIGDTEEEIARNRKRLSIEFEVAGHLTQGFNLHSMGLFDPAILQAEKALNLNPDSRTGKYLLNQSRCCLASEHARTGLTHLALSLCQQVLESDAEFPLAYFVLSEAYYRSGALDEAIAAAEEGARRAPQYLSRRYDLATYYVRKGMVEQSKAQLRELLKVLPGDPILLRRLSEMN